MILRFYSLLALWTTIFATPQDVDDMAQIILRDMSQRKNDIQKKERSAVAKDVIATVNELNFRIKSIFLEIREIRKSLESEKDGSKLEILKRMYDDHTKMYQESARTMNQLVDSYTANRLQVLSDNMATFDETAWQGLLSKLQAAKVLNQAFKFNHKLLHDSYLSIENVNVSTETRNYFQFLYTMGDKCDRSGPKLIDPVSLQLNDNARPEILHVEKPLQPIVNMPTVNTVLPRQPSQQPQTIQKQQDQKQQQVEYVDGENRASVDQSSADVRQTVHPALLAHHDHVHFGGNIKPQLLDVDPSFTPHAPPATSDEEANRGI